MKIALLDIGGTSIKSAKFEDGELIDIKETENEGKKGGVFLMEKAKSILSQYQEFDRIGISTAGQVNPQLGKIRYANSNIPGYTGMEVKKILQQEFGVPVAVENDVNAAAIGEANFGAGRDYQDFLCLTYGTGVGGSIVMDKKVFRGYNYSAGEFGGMILHPEKRDVKEDAFSGCYERYASTTALVEMAHKYDATLNSGRDIFSRINEVEIQNIIDLWVQEVVYGLTSLIHLFNPPCVILGGGIMNQKYILDKIREILYNNIMESYRDVVVKQAELGNQAGLWGASQIAIDFL